MRRTWRRAAALAAVPLTVCTPGEPASRAASGKAGSPLMPTQGVYGQAPAAAGGIPSVIMLTPHPQDDDPEAADPSITIDQFGLVFSPTRIVTRPGSSVIFTNSEAAVAHNVRIRAIGETRDLLNADANPGEQLTVELPIAGGYDVLCDMHPGMTAFVFASDAAHTALAAPDGTFVLEDVPPGLYTLRLWTSSDGTRHLPETEVATGSTRIHLGLPG